MSVTAVPLRPIKKGSVAKLWAGLIVLALLAGSLAWWTTGHHRFERTASGLRFQVVKEGEGPTAGAKDVVFVNYIGRLPDGTIFDRNDGQQPVPMSPAGGTIKGFSEALAMMKKGGVYRIMIPRELGYGANSPPQIPPNSALEFDVAARAVMSEAEVRQMMQQQMMMQQLQGGAGAGGPAAAGGAGAPPAGAGGAGAGAPPEATNGASQTEGRPGR
jgi:FKBP-type peptidyl-prolyl cis-trans isomerase FkpA